MLFLELVGKVLEQHVVQIPAPRDPVPRMRQHPQLPCLNAMMDTRMRMAFYVGEMCRLRI